MAGPEKSISAIVERRSYVCEHCRRMKVRCRFESNDRKCERCIKFKRECIFPVGDQRRLEQVDDIIRLEEKIDRLVSMLDSARKIPIPEQTEGIPNSGAAESHFFNPPHPPYRGTMQREINRIDCGMSTEEINPAHPHPGGSNPGYFGHGNLSPFRSEFSTFTPWEAQGMAHSTKVHAEDEETEDTSNFGDDDAAESHCFDPQHPPCRGAMQGDSNRIDCGMSTEEINPAHPQPGGSNHGYFGHGNMSPFSSESSRFTPWEAQGMTHPTKVHGDASTDIFGQLNLSFDTASETFDHYVNNMAPHLPVVVFPIGLNIASMQASQQILYLAILSVGSAALYPGTQRQLAKRIQKMFAILIICHGHKSLEIVQALLVCCIWYQPAPSPEQVNCNQMLAMAAVMVEEISCTGVPLEQSAEQNLGAYDWDLQFRRAWLACFILCSREDSATRGRAASRIPWSTLGEQCIDALAKRPEPLSSDLTLCQLVQYYIVADNEIQNIIRVDRGLNVLTPHGHMTPEPLGRAGLEISGHGSENSAESSSILTKEAIRMFLQEPVMHRTPDTQIFRSPLVIVKLYRAKLQGNLDALESAQRWLNVFLSLNSSDIRNLPTLHFTQAVYAILILIASTYETAGGDGLHQPIAFQNAQVRLYIEWLGNALDLASRDGNCPAAKRLCPILSKIQVELREEGESLTSDASKRHKTGTLSVPGIHGQENSCEGTAIGTLANIESNSVSENRTSHAEKCSSLLGGISFELPPDLSNYMPTIDDSGDISEDLDMFQNRDIWQLNEGS